MTEWNAYALSASPLILMDGKTKTEVNSLPTGWYVIGFEKIDGTPDYGPIYHCEDGYWTDEGGEEIDRLWDPILQTYVATDAADFYVRT